jgi:hypothetical protein
MSVPLYYLFVNLPSIASRINMKNGSGLNSSFRLGTSIERQNRIRAFILAAPNHIQIQGGILIGF